MTSSISRALGRSALSEVSPLSWHAVVIGSSMSLLFILTLRLFPGEIFQGMGGASEVLIGAMNYAQIAFGSPVVTWMLYIRAAVFRGNGDTHLHQPGCSSLVVAVRLSFLVHSPSVGDFFLRWG